MDVIYGDGGYLPDRPYANAVRWWDDTTRLAWTVTDGVASSRSYRDDENARADAVVSQQAALELVRTLREQLVDGIAGFTTAQNAASADVAAANTLKTQADTLAGQAQAFAGKTVWATSDFQSLATGIGQLAQAVSKLAGWRAAVDQNAVNTDAALIFLARLAANALNPTGS